MLTSAPSHSIPSTVCGLPQLSELNTEVMLGVESSSSLTEPVAVASPDVDEALEVAEHPTSTNVAAQASPIAAQLAEVRLLAFFFMGDLYLCWYA